MTATIVVLGATLWWMFVLHGDRNYLALASGAWTTTVAFWGLFFIQRLQRRRDT